MLPYYRLCTLIFSFLFYPLSYLFKRCSRPVERILHNSLKGHNTQCETRCLRGLSYPPPGICYRNHRTKQSAKGSSNKIESADSKCPNSRVACPTEEASLDHREVGRSQVGFHSKQSLNFKGFTSKIYFLLSLHTHTVLAGAALFWDPRKGSLYCEWKNKTIVLAPQDCSWQKQVTLRDL